MENENLDLRAELAGLMGWTSEDTFLNNIGEAKRWKKGSYSKLSLASGAFHPVNNTMDAAAAAIRDMGWKWIRYDGCWTACCVGFPCYEVADTGDETRDLLALAVEVCKQWNKLD
jgi:hypothetical protein